MTDTIDDIHFRSAVNGVWLVHAPFRMYVWSLPQNLIDELRTYAKKAKLSQSKCMLRAIESPRQDMSVAMQAFCQRVRTETLIINDMLLSGGFEIETVVVPRSDNKTRTLTQLTLGVNWTPKNLKQMAVWYGKQCTAYLKSSRGK